MGSPSARRDWFVYTPSQTVVGWPTGNGGTVTGAAGTPPGTALTTLGKRLILHSIVGLFDTATSPVAQLLIRRGDGLTPYMPATCNYQVGANVNIPGQSLEMELLDGFSLLSLSAAPTGFFLALFTLIR